MRKKLYDFIKSLAGGKSKTTVYDYVMMIVIIVSLLPLTYKPDAERTGFIMLNMCASRCLSSIIY